MQFIPLKLRSSRCQTKMLVSWNEFTISRYKMSEGKYDLHDSKIDQVRWGIGTATSP